MSKQKIAELPATQVRKLCTQYLKDKNLKGLVTSAYFPGTSYADRVKVLVLDVNAAQLEVIKKDLQVFARFTEYPVDRPDNVVTVGLIEVAHGINNGARYPTQYEAQLVLDTMKALDDIYKGGAHGTNTARYITEWRERVAGEFTKIFNSPDSSPWESTLGRGNKRVLAWREHWVAPSTIIRKPEED